MASSLEEMLAEAGRANAPRSVAPGTIKASAVDPLGLRQINFDLMDMVLPTLNNVAEHVRPFLAVAWAWRQARRVVEKSGRGGADDDILRDFVDRVEAIYVWSQFMVIDAGLPGVQALSDLINGKSYRFGGQDWEALRDMRRSSTGLISPLNYGPGLRAMRWLLPVEDGVGVFRHNPDLDPALDAFEKRMLPELGHAAFSRFGAVTVKATDALRWGKLWRMDRPTRPERDAAFRMLASGDDGKIRQLGLAMVREAFDSLNDPDAEVRLLRARMASDPRVWSRDNSVSNAAKSWRRVQVRQLFRLALESLFYWITMALRDGPVGSKGLAAMFVKQALPRSATTRTARSWLLSEAAGGNPVDRLEELEAALRTRVPKELPAAIAAALRLCLIEKHAPPEDFEVADRLPLSRAVLEFHQWADLSCRDAMVRIIEIWVLAQHAYWCVGRGLADARRRSEKNILRLKVVMDEGGWSLTLGAAAGNIPEATADRLATAYTLLRECHKL